MSWRTVGESESSGRFFKWDQPGQSLEGRWLGWRPGPFGNNGAIETYEDGVRTFQPNLVLTGKLKDIAEGATIRIVYEGQRTSKTRRAYKNFTVQVADEEDE